MGAWGWALAGLVVVVVLAAPSSAQECVDHDDISLDIALDISGSMADGGKVFAARDFAVSLVSELLATGSLVEAASFTFCSTICANNLFQSPAAIAAATSLIAGTCADPAIASFCPDGTALFDAIILGSNGIRSRSAPIKLLVVVTDGQNTGGATNLAQAAAALQPPGIVARLVFVLPGSSAELQAIASAAGAHVQAMEATGPNLSSLVAAIVASTCANFRPSAAIGLSDGELRLGLPGEGFAITFDGSPSSDSEDADGALSFSWELRDPAGAVVTSASGISFSYTFDDSRLPADQWSVRLTVTDTDGASQTASRTFRVLGSPPEITLSGPSSVEVGQPIELAVSPTTDVDGGPLTVSWTIARRPPGSTLQPPPDGPVQTLPTTSADIGSWLFHAQARDDEGEVDGADHEVEVVNLPPEIELVGTQRVRVGETIHVETISTMDPDGGDLTFRWDVVQAPRSSQIQVQEGYARGTGASGASLDIATSLSDAGHWIFRLVATDDDGAPDSEVSEEIAVHVDAPPLAEIDGPTLIGSAAFPLVLDSSDSVDPESPCPALPHRCHDTLDGRPVAVPDDPLQLTWSLVDMPVELAGSYTLGAVDDALGLYAHGSTLSVDHGLLEPGDWAFQLEAVDGEGNRDTATLSVAIADDNGHPTALVTGPMRYLVSAGNVLSRDIILSGAASFDRDNILDGSPLGAGLGITRYAWEILQAPPDCTPPAVPAGTAAHTFTLFAGGHVVDPPCQGIWRLQLTVTDDDPSPATDFAETLVGIGNCPAPLCIDHPTQAAPRFVEFPPDTDIPILYHLDSTVYDSPTLAAGGLVVGLALYHENDPTTPVHVALDPNVLPSDRGGQPSFQWNGRTAAQERPLPGRYSIEISLLNPHLGTTSFVAREQDAIAIQFIEYVVDADADDLVSLDAVRVGEDTVTVPYTAWGGLQADTLQWHVLHGSEILHTATAPPQSGVIEWNGRLADGSLVDPGIYRIELQAFRRGLPAGRIASHPVTLFATTLTWDGAVTAWHQVLGTEESRVADQGARLLITTTPRQLTVAELTSLGLPLRLFAQHSVPAGATMVPVTSPSGRAGGFFPLPAGTAAVVPETAELRDGAAGVLVTLVGRSGTPPEDEDDGVSEFASSDDAVTTPASSNHDDGDAFDAAMTARGWRAVGQARDRGSEPILRPAANRPFVTHAGTEQLWFTLWGLTTPRRQVRQQADWFYYSGHGLLITGVLRLPDGDITADEVRWDGDLDVAIIAGCSVLGIKDYRARHFPPGTPILTFEQWRLASANGLASPGEEWEQTGPDFLLGYAYAAPADVQGSLDILEDFLAAVDAGNDVVTAWGMANDPAVNPTGSNAAAIDVSQDPHRYCFWDELNTPAVWTCIEKVNGVWPDLP